MIFHLSLRLELIYAVFKNAKFVSKVANGREIDFDEIEKIAPGRVWSGIDVKENGLVDMIGGLETATVIVKEMARIPAEREVDIVELPKKGLINPNTFAPKMFGIQIEENKENWTVEYLKMISRYPGQPLPLLPPELHLEK